jgi:hypothetical protein
MPSAELLEHYRRRIGGPRGVAGFGATTRGRGAASRPTRAARRRPQASSRPSGRSCCAPLRAAAWRPMRCMRLSGRRASAATKSGSSSRCAAAGGAAGADWWAPGAAAARPWTSLPATRPGRARGAAARAAPCALRDERSAQEARPPPRARARRPPRPSATRSSSCLRSASACWRCRRRTTSSSCRWGRGHWGREEAGRGAGSWVAQRQPARAGCPRRSPTVGRKHGARTRGHHTRRARAALAGAGGPPPHAAPAVNGAPPRAGGHLPPRRPPARGRQRPRGGRRGARRRRRDAHRVPAGRRRRRGARAQGGGAAGAAAGAGAGGGSTAGLGRQRRRRPRKQRGQLLVLPRVVPDDARPALTQRALAEERVEALLVDRRVRQEEEERHHAAAMLQVRGAVGKRPGASRGSSVATHVPWVRATQTSPSPPHRWRPSPTRWPTWRRRCGQRPTTT